jgi:transcriptional regulator with XRE-family HTH domain
MVERLDDLTVGQRVARCRKARGMSQEMLAHLLGRSPSWLTKVERGERQLDRMSLMVEVARALQVDLTEITGQPYRPSTGSTTQAAVPALRRVLLSYDGQDGDATLPVGVDSVPVLRARLQAVNELRHHADYERLGDVLPALLEDIQLACVRLDGHDRDQALELLVEGCHCARSMLRMLGYVDLAWIAVKRAGQAAARLGDPLLQAANTWNRVEVLFATGAASTGVELALAAIDELDGGLGTAPPEQLSLLGIMHLKAAWGSAYVGDERQARIHEAEAVQAAELIGADRNDFGTVFGPTNLTIHRIGLAMELGDAYEALRLASSIEPRAVPYRERRARLHLDLARAHAQFRRQDVAIRLLLDSERAAPNYLRNHPVAREIVTGMMHRPRATHSELRALAVKVGAC